MPDFEVAVVWKATPVRIIVLDEQTATDKRNVNGV
jgi:hypothetical protein